MSTISQIINSRSRVIVNAFYLTDEGCVLEADVFPLQSDDSGETIPIKAVFSTALPQEERVIALEVISVPLGENLLVLGLSEKEYLLINLIMERRFGILW